MLIKCTLWLYSNVLVLFKGYNEIQNLFYSISRFYSYLCTIFQANAIALINHKYTNNDLAVEENFVIRYVINIRVNQIILIDWWQFPAWKCIGDLIIFIFCWVTQNYHILLIWFINVIQLTFIRVSRVLINISRHEPALVIWLL